jgi:hypothetical protein
MVYDNLPMADHFRKASDTILIGAMEANVQKRPGYFYLTRLATPARPYDPKFVASEPPRTATAALLHAPGTPFEMNDVEIEKFRPDEVVVRIEAVGVCHSDLVIAGMAQPQQLPMVLGHEGAGVVEAIGEDVTDLRPGDRVVLSYAWCGRCTNCRRDRMAYCAQSNLLNLAGTRPDGSAGMAAATPNQYERDSAANPLSPHTRSRSHTRWYAYLTTYRSKCSLRSDAACRPAQEPCSTCCNQRRARR